MKEIKITSNGIKQAIDDLANENEMLQDKIYKLQDKLQQKENIIKEVREYIEKRQDTQKWRKESLKENSTNIDIVLEHYRDILEILKDSDKE